METGDKINELYYGQVFSGKEQAEARQRIHWICRRVKGHKVIDIGCNQGIVSILLPREGFEVIGIDISDRAIEFANAEKEKELPVVQQKLTFIKDSVYDINLPTKDFNTVIMGEFLEHLANPDIAISKAYELLVNDGTLVITVPFGLLNDPDHKQTFYIASKQAGISSF